MKTLKAVLTNSLYTVIIGVFTYFVLLKSLKVFSFLSHNTVINCDYFIKVQNEFIR